MIVISDNAASIIIYLCSSLIYYMDLLHDTRGFFLNYCIKPPAYEYNLQCIQTKQMLKKFVRIEHENNTLKSK